MHGGAVGENQDFHLIPNKEKSIILNNNTTYIHIWLSLYQTFLSRYANFMGQIFNNQVGTLIDIPRNFKVGTLIWIGMIRYSEV